MYAQVIPIGKKYCIFPKDETTTTFSIKNIDCCYRTRANGWKVSESDSVFFWFLTIENWKKTTTTTTTTRIIESIKHYDDDDGDGKNWNLWCSKCCSLVVVVRLLVCFVLFVTKWSSSSSWCYRSIWSEKTEKNYYITQM